MSTNWGCAVWHRMADGSLGGVYTIHKYRQIGNLPLWGTRPPSTFNKSCLPSIAGDTLRASFAGLRIFFYIMQCCLTLLLLKDYSSPAWHFPHIVPLDSTYQWKKCPSCTPFSLTRTWRNVNLSSHVFRKHVLSLTVKYAINGSAWSWHRMVHRIFYSQVKP